MPLVRELYVHHGTYFVGTVRENRKYIDKELVVEDKDKPIRFSSWTGDVPVQMVSWRDK
jgi:hypothetical protein